ncbi:hypothetical protein NDU88_002466 [Pleurodeles waltl]|uniref:Uncharacterized protein n=1 Tax=Pleurodeles waltl TaxID=8319 RepID=A0AAV7TKM1_PLEWA|nr:hypothetical protein NDU88_002466 [Pleurodeles waltl]
MKSPVISDRLNQGRGMNYDVISASPLSHCFRSLVFICRSFLQYQRKSVSPAPGMKNTHQTKREMKRGIRLP